MTILLWNLILSYARILNYFQYACLCRPHVDGALSLPVVRVAQERDLAVVTAFAPSSFSNAAAAYKIHWTWEIAAKELVPANTANSECVMWERCHLCRTDVDAPLSLPVVRAAQERELDAGTAFATFSLSNDAAAYTIHWTLKISYLTLPLPYSSRCVWPLYEVFRHRKGSWNGRAINIGPNQ